MQITILSYGFEGHRAIWLECLLVAHANSDISIKLIVVSSESHFLENWGKPLSGEGYSVVCVKKRSIAIQVAAEINSEKGKNVNIIWDADSWLSYIPFIKFPCRILFLRHAINKSNPWLFLKSKVKQLLINNIGSINKNLVVRYLTSPFLKRNEKSNLGVSDDLIGVLLKGYSSHYEKQSKAPGKIKLLIPGFITWRKRPDLIVNFVKANHQHGDDSNYMFVFSGKMDERSKSFLEENACSCMLLVNQYLSYSDYIRKILDSSVVLLPYDDFGSSNVLTESVHLGIPVVLKESSYWEKLDQTLTTLIYKSDFSPDNLQMVLEDILKKNGASDRKALEFKSFLIKNELLAFLSGA